MASPREDFINLMYQNSKTNGFDDLTSVIVAILYAEPGSLSLEELAKMTGYSVSSVCTATKFMERAGLVRKFRKPTSKKVFLEMEKDMVKTSVEMWQKKYQKNLIPTIQKLPGIIENYRGLKDERSKEELKVIEKYYQQAILLDGLIGDINNLFTTALEKSKAEEKAKIHIKTTK